jgi:LysM domain
MRITTRRPFGRISPVLAIAALALGACSSTSMPGPSWNLTGGKDRAPMPPKPIYADPPKQAALAPSAANAPVATYRGGRDPITGRAPSFGGAQPGFQPAQPPLPPTEPRPRDQRSQASNPNARTVEVRPGQTLSMIATEQRVSLAGLMAANNLRDPYLIPGQILTIPNR